MPFFKRWLIFQFLLAISIELTGIAADIKITAETKSKEIVENQPIPILITVEHSSNETIDSKSFKLEDKPIIVRRVTTQRMTATGDLILSIFEGNAPPQSKGAYLLPAVEARINGKTYSSIPSTYKVVEGSTAKARPDTSATSKGSTTGIDSTITLRNFQNANLRFEAFVEGPTTLYPGQKTILGYRYQFNTSIATLSEETPLLEAQGLIKVGDKILNQEQRGENSISEIYQIAKGGKPGSYQYGPSTIVGVAYEETADGEKIFGKEKLSATAKEITINVLPFPEANRPPSFNGALGSFNWQVHMLTPSKLTTGEKIKLKITASGKGDWDSVKVSELCCMPGMSGLFRFSDLPATGEMHDDVKNFQVELQPLSTSIHEIPSFQFSSFEPDNAQYHVVTTPSIPIWVEAPTLTTTTAPKEAPANEGSNWRENFDRVAPLKIGQSPPLTQKDLSNLLGGTWWSLLLIPFGMGFLLFQYNWKQFLASRAETESQPSSRAIFEEAFSLPTGSLASHENLKKAFLIRLKELKEIESIEIDPEQLADTGRQGKVKTLIARIDASRYSGNAIPSDQELTKAAQALFDQL